MNLAEAYGRLAEQAEEASGADLAHPLHGLWTKADAGNSGSPLSPSCVGLAEYVVGSCFFERDALQHCQAVAVDQSNILACLRTAERVVSPQCHAALDTAFVR